MADSRNLDAVIEINDCSGVAGPSLYVDNFRVAGSKPWGGGSFRGTWTTTRRAVLTALAGAPTRAALAALDPEAPLTITVDPIGISFGARVLVAEPIKLINSPRAWRATARDVMYALTGGHPTVTGIKADIHTEVPAWHAERRALEVVAMLDLLFGPAKA